jgi:hypothetical protein
VFAPLADIGGGAAGRLPRYVVDRLRERSRVLEPEQQVNPFAAWQGKPDGLGEELTALADVKDPGELETRTRRLLRRADEGRAALPRLDALIGVLALSARAGDTLATELLRRAVELSRELAGSNDPGVLARQGALLERALAVAVARGRREEAKGLAVAAGDWLKRAAEDGRLDQSADLTAAALRPLGKLGLREETRRLLRRAGEGLPEGEGLRPLAGHYDKRWPDALAGLLHQAGGWLRLGQADKAAPALAAARTVLLPAGGVAAEQRRQPVALARLACAYAGAVGQEPPEAALRRLQELFGDMEPPRDTFTTSTHYSLLGLSVVEAATLALVPSDE